MVGLTPTHKPAAGHAAESREHVSVTGRIGRVGAGGVRNGRGGSPHGRVTSARDDVLSSSLLQSDARLFVGQGEDREEKCQTEHDGAENRGGGDHHGDAGFSVMGRILREPDSAGDGLRMAARVLIIRERVLCGTIRRLNNAPLMDSTAQVLLKRASL